MAHAGGPRVALHGDPLDLRWLGSDRGLRACRFIERFCRLTKGRGAGSLVKLRPWQREIVRGALSTGVRQAYVSMARKNGKTTLGACLALFGLCGDDEQGAEVYCVAGDEKQARLTFSIATRMVQLDERLAGVVQVYRDALEHQASGSVLVPLPAEADLRLGLNPSLTVFDEIAVQRTDDLWLAMQLAMGAREHPLLFGITTPGYEMDSLAWRLDQHGRRGDDPSFFWREFAAPIGSPIDDEAAWAEANPALDDFMSREDMRAAVRSTPEHAFRRFRLGQWTATAETWIPHSAWAARADADAGIDGPVVLAFDGSASGDSTALVGATVSPTPHVFTVDVWANPGDPRWRVPRREVSAVIDDAFERLDVVELACDPWGWRGEIETWLKTHGRVVEYPSNVAARIGPATDLFYSLVMEGNLSHDGDERLAAHVAHCVAKPSPHGDLVTKDRKNSPRKIDAAVCAIVAVARATWHAANPQKVRRGRVLVA
jgi:phage terminase large subunit-like protein